MQKAAFVLVMACLIGAEGAQACQCGDRPELRIAAEKSEAVFAGKATIEKVKNVPGMADWPIQTVKFAVSKVWRGSLDDVFVLETGSSSCDFYFEDKREYLVFLTRAEGGRLVAHECYPTQRLPIAETLLEGLGLSRKPRKLTFWQKVGVWWHTL